MKHLPVGGGGKGRGGVEGRGGERGGGRGGKGRGRGEVAVKEDKKKWYHAL